MTSTRQPALTPLALALALGALATLPSQAQTVSPPASAASAAEGARRGPPSRADGQPASRPQARPEAKTDAKTDAKPEAKEQAEADKARQLIDAANAAGGRDNISVVLVQAAADSPKRGFMSRLLGAA